MNTINHLIDPTMAQRIDQMAKNLAVASIFSQHPQQNDDYERVLNTKNPMGKFTLDNFYLCDDYLFDHADKIIERLESEYDKLKDFAWQVLAVKQVWKLTLDWDGNSRVDVVIANQTQAEQALIDGVNSILDEENCFHANNLDLIDEVVGSESHHFWQTHRPFIYSAKLEQIT